MQVMPARVSSEAEVAAAMEEWKRLGELPDCCVWSTCGVVSFEVAALDEMLSGDKPCKGGAAAREGRACEEREYPPVALMKVDVEGQEDRVLAGASALFGNPCTRPWYAFFEFHVDRIRGEGEKEEEEEREGEEGRIAAEARLERRRSLLQKLFELGYKVCLESSRRAVRPSSSLILLLSAGVLEQQLRRGRRPTSSAPRHGGPALVASAADGPLRGSGSVCGGRLLAQPIRVVMRRGCILFI